jgi:hypothetical protein
VISSFLLRAVVVPAPGQQADHLTRPAQPRHPVTAPETEGQGQSASAVRLRHCRRSGKSGLRPDRSNRLYLTTRVIIWRSVPRHSRPVPARARRIGPIVRKECLLWNRTWVSHYVAKWLL